jgi:hypothetical protein
MHDDHKPWMTTCNLSQTTLSAGPPRWSRVDRLPGCRQVPACSFLKTAFFNTPPPFQVVFASLATMGDTIMLDEVCTRVLAEVQRITPATPSVHNNSERVALAAHTADQRNDKQDTGAKEDQYQQEADRQILRTSSAFPHMTRRSNARSVIAVATTEPTAGQRLGAVSTEKGHRPQSISL